MLGAGAISVGFQKDST